MKPILVAAMAALSITAARADDWPLPRHDAQNSGATTTPIVPPFARTWSKTGATNEPILVAGDTLLYTARRGGGLRDLVALNAATGKQIWTVKNVTQTGAASVADGVVVTVARQTDKPTSVSKLGANLWPTSIAGVDLRTGKVRWTRPIGDHPVYPAISPLTIANHSAYIVNIPYCVPGDACGPGELIALDARSGKEMAKYAWNAVWGDQIGTVDGPPVVDGNGSRVVIGLGYAAAPNAYGGQLWGFWADKRLADGPIFKLGDPSVGTGEVSPYAHKGGNALPLLGGTFLAVQGPVETTRVWDVSQFPAKLQWEIRFTKDYAHSVMPGGLNPLLLEYNAGAGLLSGMYISDGKRIWTKPIKATGLSSTAGNVVYVPGTAQHPKIIGAARTDIQDGVLYALDTTTGRLLWSERRPDVTYNAPVPANGHLYVSDSDGTLACYTPVKAPSARRARTQRRGRKGR